MGHPKGMPPRKRGGRAVHEENSEKWEREQQFVALRREISREIFENKNRKEKQGEEFLTEHSLEKIWTYDRLTQILKLADIIKPSPSRQDIEDARDNFKKIFSILIEIGWTEWPQFGELFWDHHDGEGDRIRIDKNLPFVQEEMRRDDFLGDVYASKFTNQQFIFIPICIEAGTHNKPLPGLRLPFVNEKKKVIGKGGYGEVTKEVIAYRQFSYKNESRSLNEEELPVACKHFKYQETFEKEIGNLSTLRTALSRNTRIVSFLATVSMEDRFYIFSPLAETDLEKFLYQQRSENFDVNMANLITEASNLAHALDFLHTQIYISVPGSPLECLACCHMDLKPANILVFPSRGHPVGIWKITDFGISTLKQTTSSAGKGNDNLGVPTTVGMMTTKTFPQRDKGTFQAPEVNEFIEPMGSKRVGRKSDIWSFGCILVLIFAFGLGGLQELKDFDKGRRQEETGVITDFFYSKNPESQDSDKWIINPHVEEFLSKLPGYGSQGSRGSVSLNYNKCQKLLRGMLVASNPNLRLEAIQVSKRLGEVFPHISKLNSACIRPVSRKRDNSIGSSSTDADSVSVSHHQDTPRSHSGDRAAKPSPSDGKRQPENLLGGGPQTQITSPPRRPIEVHAATPPHGDSPSRAEILKSTDISGRNEFASKVPSILVSRASQTGGHNRQSSGSGSVSSMQRIDEQPESLTTASLEPTAARRLEQSSQRSQTVQLIQSPPRIPEPPTSPPESVATGSISLPMTNTITRTPSKRTRNLSAPKNSKAIFMSSSGHRLALLSEKDVHVHFLNCDSLPCKIPIPPNVTDMKWQTARLADDYVCLKGIGKHSKDDIFVTYQISVTEDEQVSLQTIGNPIRNPSLISMDVSPSRRLLFETDNGVKLDNLSSDKLLVEKELRRTTKGEVRQVWFGGSGIWCFAWTQTARFQYVYIWEVANRDNCMEFEHAIKESDQNVKPIKGIISFPKSRAYVLWEQDDYVSIIRFPKHTKSPRKKKIPRLRAVVVAPNEDVLIFVQRSEVSFAPIDSTIGELQKLDNLKHTYDETGNRSSVTIRAGTSQGFTVVVAHKTGKVEELSV